MDYPKARKSPRTEFDAANVVMFAVGLSILAACARPEPTEAVTFSRHIAPILYKNCAECHRPNQVAPFSLLTYDDAKKRDRMIAYVTAKRRMPPWKAEPGYGEFEDARSLSDDELSLIRQWVDAGSPAGDLSELPAVPKFHDGWALGEPDLVVTMPEPYTIPAEGPDIYRCFVFPLNLDKDTYVRAAEFRPGNRRVVHHSLLFIDSNGVGRKLDAKEPGQGYTRVGGPGFMPAGSLDGWAPGTTVRPLPDGVGWFVRRGSDLVIQTHFHPTGKVEQEQSSIGLYFCKTRPEKQSFTLPILSREIDIPPGEANHVVRASLTIPSDATSIGVIPHAHLLGRELKATYTLPDGATRWLVWIKDWDFNRQDHYRYKEPIDLPRGTRIDIEYTYDNSAANPRNPNRPPKRVQWGEQTNDEMCILFLQFVPRSAKDMPALMALLVNQTHELFKTTR
jgi:mono/diheme cytochrome c family protein